MVYGRRNNKSEEISTENNRNKQYPRIIRDPWFLPGCLSGSSTLVPIQRSPEVVTTGKLFIPLEKSFIPAINPPIAAQAA
jgi:hypothetical protein